MYRYHKPVKLKVFTRVEQFISNEIGHLTPNLECRKSYSVNRGADRRLIEEHPCVLCSDQDLERFFDSRWAMTDIPLSCLRELPGPCCDTRQP